MSDENKPILVPNPRSAPDDTSFLGHGTRVMRRKSLNGDYVEKTVRDDGDFADDVGAWMDSSIGAKDISDAIRAKNNPAYTVPKTFISHGHVREELASGEQLRDMGRNFVSDNQDWVIPALANFINDMSELQPVKRPRATQSVRHMSVRNVSDLEFLMMIMPHQLPRKDMNFLVKVYKYLRDLPENQTLVFAHADMHSGNIMVDAENKKVTIIDFEMVNWISQLQAMYIKRATANAQLWEYVNKLPRTTNPDLTWEYDEHKHTLFSNMGEVVRVIRNSIYEPEKNKRINLDEFFEQYIYHMRVVWGMIKIVERKRKKKPAPVTAIVPKSHYEK